MRQNLQGTKFEIRRILGEGGFGVTYLAYDTSNQRYVAIKESRQISEKSRNKMLKEARILAGLGHVRNIVRVYDCFEEDGTAFVVMEHVQGTPLAEYMKTLDSNMTFEEAWTMLKPVAAAMKQVHSAGIIHRDLTPSNIMILEDGSIKIIDFGAGREFAHEPRTMTIIVKEGYAPPEQYDMKSSQGPHTDVYSLCAIIYEMITGVIPPNSVDRISDDSLYPPSIYGAEISPTNEEALQRGLAPDAADRVADMGELIDLFDSRIEATAETGKGKELLAILTGVFVALILAAIAITIWQPDSIMYALYNIFSGEDDTPALIGTGGWNED